MHIGQGLSIYMYMYSNPPVIGSDVAQKDNFVMKPFGCDLIRSCDEETLLFVTGYY